MPPVEDLSKSRINWDKISERDFNHVVEVLLIKMHAKSPYKVDVIRGAGGDTGIDVVVWQDHGAVRIYQLKYFPEGFTGGFRDARRPQVKNSFDTAWRNHAPAEWILVMPPDPHVNERNYVETLAEGKSVDVSIWGQKQLAAALTDYPEVERAFTRDDLVETLKQIHQEKSGLVGGRDLTERLKDLVGLADTRSQYWDVRVTAQGSEVFEEYIPKHPDAMRMEPINTTIQLRFEESHQNAANQVKEGFEYGFTQDFELPVDTVTVSRTGPSWVQPLPEMLASRFSMGPARSNSHLIGKPMTFSFLDKNGFTRGRFEGLITHQAYGTLGSTVRASFDDLATLIMKIPFDGPPTFKMNLTSIVGRPVRDVHRALQMLRSFQPGCSVDLYIGDSHTAIQVPDAPMSREDDAWTEALVDDLFVIENSHLRAKFIVPEEVAPSDRINIRVARLLLEGHQTVYAPGQSIAVTLSGELDDALFKLLTEGGVLLLTQQATPFVIQGGKYNLGPGVIYHPHVKASEGAEMILALQAGTAAGRVVHLYPVDETPFRVWLLPEGDAREGRRPSYVPWGIPTFDEPDPPQETLE